MDRTLQRLVSVVPGERQLAWQRLEFTAFIHYGMNAFTDREWGDGKEPLSLFDPRALDTDQWCESLAAAGIRACLYTAKHHDGFCMWATRQTDHNVMNTPYGKDIVASLAASCRKYGLKLGIYLSPWDRHEAVYGMGKPYDDFFCAQLEELLTNYGDIYAVWFDGACGEGPNGKRQVYDWERYYGVIRRLQPGAVISVCGPDVRWCGNEAGDTRVSEWSVVPAALRDAERIQEASQQADDEAFREKTIKSTDQDLGSREAVRGARELVWYPAEVNTSIRPGWFHHDSEDDKVRPLEKLIDIYCKSIGNNSVFLLNVPPHREGYFAEPDVRRLREIGDWQRATFRNNWAEGAACSASSTDGNHAPEHVLADDETFWKPEDGTESCRFRIKLPKAREIRHVVLMEQLLLSQRVEAFTILVRSDAGEVPVHRATTIGYKRICPLSAPIVTDEVIIRFDASRVCPTLRFVGLYGN